MFLIQINRKFTRLRIVKKTILYVILVKLFAKIQKLIETLLFYFVLIRYVSISKRCVVKLQYWYIILLKSFKAGLPIFYSKLL